MATSPTDSSSPTMNDYHHHHYRHHHTVNEIFTDTQRSYPHQQEHHKQHEQPGERHHHHERVIVVHQHNHPTLTSNYCEGTCKVTPTAPGQPLVSDDGGSLIDNEDQIAENNSKETTCNVALNLEGTKKFRSKAFLLVSAPKQTKNESISNINSSVGEEEEENTFSIDERSNCKNNSNVHSNNNNTNEPLSTTIPSIIDIDNTDNNNNNTTTKIVDPYSLSMRSNNQQTETSGKRKSSSSTPGFVDTITHARKLVSGFGISTKDSKIDLLYATKLSSLSNSGTKKKHTRKTNGKEMERFLFCKYCKLSNKSLDSGRLQLKTCSLCREVRYCCKEHQVADWPKHKFECNCAVRALNNGTYSKLLQKGDETNRPQIGDSVSVHYVAKLLNDTIIDKTYKSIETNQHCNVSYDTSDDEDGEDGFDDDKDLYIVKPPSNSYTDFENWLSHANNKYLLKQRKSVDDSDAESTSNSEVFDNRSSVASSFSDLSFATSCTDSSRLTYSQRSEDDMSLYSTNSSISLPPIVNESEEPEENWSTDSSGRGGGTSSSTSTVSIIFDSVSKDIEVVPDLLQFTIGKGKVNADIEKHLCQMSLGERRYLFVSPKSRQNNPKLDILSKRVKKLSDFTIVYEIMIVQILRKKDGNENHHLLPSSQPTTCTKPIYGQDEFTKDNETYQSCFYEPFRRFIPSSSTLC